jgi:hypothetical protein
MRRSDEAGVAPDRDNEPVAVPNEDRTLWRVSLMGIRTSAFLTAWQQTGLQKSRMHALRSSAYAPTRTAHNHVNGL